MIRRGRVDRDAAAAISGVDQKLRECLQVLWLSLPNEHKNEESVEHHYRRLVERALRDFKEDLQNFPPFEQRHR